MKLRKMNAALRKIKENNTVMNTLQDHSEEVKTNRFQGSDKSVK